MAEDKKVFDVSKPGKTKADATSRPVIIGHKVAVSDGTLAPGADTENTTPADPLATPAEESATSSEESKLSPVSEKKLTPSAELVEQVRQDKASGKDEAKEVGETKSALPEDEPAVEETKTEEPQSKAETEQSNEEPAKDEKPPKLDAKPVGNESAVNTVLGEAGTIKEAEIAELERQEKVKKLVDEGKYELPIGQPKHHHGSISFFKGLLILLIVLLLTVAGFVLAIDAELIKTNYKLPFDLIKVAKTEPTPQTPSPAKTPTPAPPATTPKTAAFVLPTGWQWYENKELGFKFAYPNNYGKFSKTSTTTTYIIEKSAKPNPQYAPGSDSEFVVNTANSLNDELSTVKYGPQIKYTDGKLIVVSVNPADEVNKVGTEYKNFNGDKETLKSNGSLKIFLVSGQDEGNWTYKYIFTAKNKLNFINIPPYFDGVSICPDDNCKANDRTKYDEMRKQILESIQLI